MYCPPNTQANALPNLLEAVSGWGLEYHRLIVLSDFSVHANDAASPQAKQLVSSVEALGLSPFILTLTHQAGHTLDSVSGIVI